MDYTTSEKNGIAFIDIKGEIDLYNVDRILKFVKNLKSREQYRVIANLERVPYIDSEGLGVFLRVKKALNNRGGDLKLLNVSQSLSKIFQPTNLTSHFDFFDSEEEALGSFPPAAV